jgi:hypothetical protein
MSNLEIAEMCARSGANCGSLFLDLRFRELVRTLLEDHPAHLDAPSLAYFMHNFSETDKLAYLGEVDDGESSWAIRMHSRLFRVFFHCWPGTLTSPIHCMTLPVLGFR